MPNKKRVLAFDYGASSGRAMLASYDGKTIQMEEIHRFSNDPVQIRDTFYWDIPRLFFEMKQAIAKAVQHGGFDSIGIDTWGVDFGMLDKRGNLIKNPVHYRDLRTQGVSEEVFKLISKAEIYKKTGIQHMRFNTLYQLAYLAKEEPDLLAQTDKILMTPDLLAYFLTDSARCETTIASTTNFYNPLKRAFEPSLLETIGVSPSILAEPIASGESYGVLSNRICEELGCQPVPVIAVGTHDTASAVVSAPTNERDFIYISCGTWSLFGTEVKAPIMTEQAQKLNFTNEVGVEHTIRLLKNIMGLWLIQECRRHWIRQGEDVTFNMLENEALEAKPFQCFIDPDDASFETAGNLPERVRQYCVRTNQYVPQTRGEIMRCIYQSLALKYRYSFDSLQELTGKKYRSIHMLGGGIKDTLLCRMTANATGVTVKAGPIEATITGNIVAQLIGLGELKDVKEARSVIRNSTTLHTYEPVQADEWNTAYETYSRLLHHTNP